MENLPKSWKKSALPHKFCSGCGQALALKILGFAIDELNIQDKAVYGSDIGCSLLSWNMFDVDTVQTHHGRATPTMVGLKRAKPEVIAIAFMGDGGGYAIGAQHLINSCLRDDKITVILINNANYAMTGGQMAPTTLVDEKTTTTPAGRKISEFGRPIHGPEMLATIAAPGAYMARCTSDDFETTKNYIKNALVNQIEGKGFSFVEILSMCPVNWKTNAQQSIDFIEEMKKTFPLGEIKVSKDVV
ncbi:MAG: thiamine pyrophosphate-dependent enzyme [Patescibacteria group bacterium]|jgi:2-oxoglutarate ferredoxin oxidoreductase subunit beta